MSGRHLSGRTDRVKTAMSGIVEAVNHTRGRVAILTEEEGYTVVETAKGDAFAVGDEVRWEGDGARRYRNVTRETVAELRKRIAHTELRVLGEAPFPLDEEIPPIACSGCPSRSVNQAGLFSDLLQDSCTDPSCYENKLKVWARAELEAADRAGRKLLMLYDGSAENKAGVSKWDVVVGATCPSQEQAIWVSGRMIEKREPWPGLDEISMRPRMASTFLRTTSMPTPRPDTSVTTAAVENPGSKMSCQTSASLIRSFTRSRPRSCALARMRSRSRPRPSSSISMTRLPWR